MNLVLNEQSEAPQPQFDYYGGIFANINNYLGLFATNPSTMT